MTGFVLKNLIENKASHKLTWTSWDEQWLQCQSLSELRLLTNREQHCLKLYQSYSEFFLKEFRELKNPIENPNLNLNLLL